MLILTVSIKRFMVYTAPVIVKTYGEIYDRAFYFIFSMGPRKHKPDIIEKDMSAGEAK